MQNARLDETQAGVRIAGRNINNPNVLYPPGAYCVQGRGRPTVSQDINQQKRAR